MQSISGFPPKKIALATGHSSANAGNNWWWRGEWFGNTPKSKLFFSASPRERLSLPSRLCNRYPASPRTMTASATGHGNEGAQTVCNQYPASLRKKIALATGHGNEGAIRANAGNKRNYDLHDCFGQSPVFEGKKTGEKGGHQVARVCTCCGK